MHHRVQSPADKGRPGVGVESHEELLAVLEVHLAVGDAELHARSLVGDTPVEHEHVRVEDPAHVEVEHGVAPLLGGHRVVGRPVALDAVALREEDIEAHGHESVRKFEVEAPLSFREQWSCEVDQHVSTNFETQTVHRASTPGHGGHPVPASQGSSGPSAALPPAAPGQRARSTLQRRRSRPKPSDLTAGRPPPLSLTLLATARAISTSSVSRYALKATRKGRAPTATAPLWGSSVFGP